MARKKLQMDEPTGDEWLGTYADCVTLLMTFFVLLYSMSSVDAGKFNELSQAFKSVLTGESVSDSILDYSSGNVPLIGEEEDESDTTLESTTEDSMYYQVKQYVSLEEIQDYVDVLQTDEGVVLQLNDSVLFDSGSASLIDGSTDLLDSITNILSNLTNDIEIEGHTDNVPINNENYSSNWDLSCARASTVLRYFVETKGLEATRFCATGYGDTEPIVDNDTDENRAKNRRVNILILASDNEG